MPSKSPAQHRLMEMVAHDPGAAKRLGIPVGVGQDFVAADKGKRFALGGAVPEHFALVAEHPTHFVVHDHRDGGRFPVAKHGLSAETVGRIQSMPRMQHFDAGGMADPAEMGMTPEDLAYRAQYAGMGGHSFASGPSPDRAQAILDARQQTRDDQRAMADADAALAPSSPRGGYQPSAEDYAKRPEIYGSAPAAAPEASAAIGQYRKLAEKSPELADAWAARLDPTHRAEIEGFKAAQNPPPTPEAGPAAPPEVAAPPAPAASPPPPALRSAGAGGGGDLGRLEVLGNRMVESGMAGSDESMNAIKSGVSAEQAAIGKEAEAKAGLATESAKVQQAHNTAMEAMYAQQDADHARRQAEVDRTYELAKQQIDPGRWFATRSSGQKVAAVLASVAGGFLQGRTGGRNPGLDAINQAIEADIGAQKANIEQANTQYGMAQHALKSSDVAWEEKRAHAEAAVAGQLKYLADNASAPIVRADAEKLSAQLGVQSQETLMRAQEAQAQHGLATLGHVEAVRSRFQAQGNRKEDKADAKIEKDLADYEKSMNFMESARGPAADLQKRVMASERVDADLALIKQRGATPQDLQKVATEIQTLISQGHATEGEINSMMPHTLRGSLADKLQWITNHPQDAHAKEFLDRFAGTLETEKQTLRNQKERSQASIYSARGKALEKRAPDRVKEIHQALGFDPGETLDKNGAYVPLANRMPVAAPAAKTGPYGPSVKQRGVTFTWNPKTEQYEP